MYIPLTKGCTSINQSGVFTMREYVDKKMYWFIRYQIMLSTHCCKYGIKSDI